MALYLATYDLQRTNPQPHAEFIKQGNAIGWYDWIADSNGKMYKLPNTTLIGYFDTLHAAHVSFFQIASLTQAQGYTVNVEKWFICKADEHVFNSDVHT